jgi:hypothetical protein
MTLKLNRFRSIYKGLRQDNAHTRRSSRDRIQQIRGGRRRGLSWEVAHLVKKFPRSYWIQRFITMFITPNLEAADVSPQQHTLFENKT